MSSHAQSTTQPRTIDHDALDRLEKLERLDRLEAEERSAQRRRLETLDGKDSSDAADATAVGAGVLRDLVDSLGQAHLAERPGQTAADRGRLLRQLQSLQQTMTPGGVADYVRRARKLLAASREGKNPFADYVPSVPAGHTLALGDASLDGEFARYEAAGAAAARTSAFVLVAGGLGERLGFSGIKLALPAETLSSTPYLELYCKHILALEAHSHVSTRATPRHATPTRLGHHAHAHAHAPPMRVRTRGDGSCRASSALIVSISTRLRRPCCRDIVRPHHIRAVASSAVCRCVFRRSRSNRIRRRRIGASRW
jgi:hypothetical protein